jgi:hypothetical protein
MTLLDPGRSGFWESTETQMGTERNVYAGRKEDAGSDR